MRKSENEKFVLFENYFFELDSQYVLTPDELFIYAYLYKYQNFNHELMINVDTLHLGIKYYNGKSNKLKTINLIIDCIASLHNKNIIHIRDGIKISRTSVLFISFPLAMNRLTTKKFDDKILGFVPIDYDLFEQFNDPYELYIYSMVKKFQNAGSLIFSFGQWSKYLDLKRSTAQDRVNKFIEKGLIYKESGAWVDIDNVNKVFKQDVNKYMIADIDKQKLEYIENKKEKSKEETNPKHNDKVKVESNVNINSNAETRIHSWNSTEKGVYPNVDDYVIYLTTSDEKLKQKASSRIAALSKSEYGKSQVDKNMSEAEQMLKKEKLELEQEEQKKYNTVTLYTGEKIRLDGSNIDKVDFEQVECVNYLMGSSIAEAKFILINGVSTENRKQINDNVFNCIVDEFKKYVHNGGMITMEQLVEIRNKVESGVFNVKG